MKLRIGFFPEEPNYASVHIDKRVTKENFEHFNGPNNDKEYPQFVRELFNLKGVEGVCLRQHEISLTKGDVFDWNDIIISTKEIIRKHFNPGGEIEELVAVRRSFDCQLQKRRNLD